MKLKIPFMKSEEERLEVEDFINAMAAGAFLLVILSPLALFIPVLGFNMFLLVVVIPYYAGYQAGKRTDNGAIAGLILGIAWTAVEFMLLFLIGNKLSVTGQVRITSTMEMILLVLFFASNTGFCWLGGRVGTRKRFFHRRMDEGTQTAQT